MNFGHDKNKMKVEGDRLSNLPDDLILKILSLIGTKRAIKTSVLSSRWRYIWTSMTSINFSNREFHTLAMFSKYVTQVLSRRNNQIEVSTVSLTMLGKISEAFFKRILNKVLNYALSHNVQDLHITCPPRMNIKSPLSVNSSKCLIHLTLVEFVYKHFAMIPCTWELPALATLNLYGLTLYSDDTDKSFGLFSNCANLKNLTIKNCELNDSNGFNICHPELSDLTLENCREGGKVVTPKLKNLIMSHCESMHLISAPNLVSLHYKSYSDPLKFSDELLHLEKAYICIQLPFYSKIDARKIVYMLQQLRSVKSLTLNLELVKGLSSCMELAVSHEPSPFTNLKSLKIYPDRVIADGHTPPELTVPIEIKNYLLESSPGATFTLVSYEEIRDTKNVESAQNLLKELQGLLDHWNTNSVTTKTHVKQGEAQMEVRDRSGHIFSYWDGLKHQLKEGRTKAVRIASMMQSIDFALKKQLPTSHRGKLQARFSDLRAMADRIMHNVTDDLKIQCDKQPRFECLFP